MDVKPPTEGAAPSAALGIRCPECGGALETRRTLHARGVTVRYKRCKVDPAHKVRTEEAITSSTRLRQLQRTGADLASEELQVPKAYADQLADVAAGSFASGAPISAIATAMKLPIATVQRMLQDKGCL